MGSLQETEMSSTMGVEVYRWLVRTLTMSRTTRGYTRLHAPVRKRVRLARLGKRQTKAVRSRRPFPRLRLRWFSPFTLLAKLRDAYVTLLQAASDKIALTEGVASYPGVPCNGGPSSDFTLGGVSLKAKEAELDRFLTLHLARARSQLLLTYGA